MEIRHQPEDEKPKKQRQYRVKRTKKIKRQRLIKFIAFLSPPIFVSLVSVFHSYDFLLIGNQPVLAAFLAAAYEVMVLSLIIVSPTMVNMGKKVQGWNLFLILCLALILAFSNVYVAWTTIPAPAITNIASLTGLQDGVQTKRAVSVFIGLPITILSLSFIPIFIEWLKKDNARSSR